MGSWGTKCLNAASHVYKQAGDAFIIKHLSTHTNKYILTLIVNLCKVLIKDYSGKEYRRLRRRLVKLHEYLLSLITPWTGDLGVSYDKHTAANGRFILEFINSGGLEYDDLLIRVFLLRH